MESSDKTSRVNNTTHRLGAAAQESPQDSPFAAALTQKLRS
jgi:hypothetical protein